MTQSLAALIKTLPRLYQPERAEDAKGLVEALPQEVRGLVAGAVSCSPYLMLLLEKEASWLAEAVEDPDAHLELEIAATRDLAPDQVGSRLRQGKRRVALLVALADLGGAWPLERVTGALTDFADAALSAALRAGLAPQIRRGKLPGATEADLEEAGGMVALAMGKMGAGELNYSSDIDLICLFDETRFDPDDYHDARMAFVKATRSMSATLSEMTAEGYVFRTDLRLRPDPAVTPVCLSMEAAERYYESLGRTWERAAYIKARPAAGDCAAGGRFLRTLRPFVWRKHLDFAAIQDAHDMRLAIREHKGLGGPITLPGHNMKLGRGGIREIEFFTQTRQLIAGGRDPDLRVRGTCEGLKVLADKGWVPEEVRDRLTENYRFHRTVEHRLQMVRDAQTHDLPQTEEGFARIAAMMDLETDDLKQSLRDRLEEVHHLTEGFFAGSRSARSTSPRGHSFDPAVTARWPTYPALRSDRGAALFERLKPGILERLGEAGKPDEALLAFDGFLAGLPAGVQLFSLLEANPQLLDLLVDIVSTSPALATYLSRNSGVFDAVIGGDFFSDWPGRDTLTQALTEAIGAEPDYEARLDRARRWTKEWHFRVGVHLLRGLIDAREAGRQYADLAGAVLAALWPAVIVQFGEKHGAPPGRGAVLVGMGSLGAGRLTPTSDLDMLVIYDAAGQEASEGRRPLPTRQYYARLTQAMITAMTAPMAEGRLYEVDMRLRPSGNQGPVATSLASFENYQKKEAWVWEHLALTRARVIAGPAVLSEEVERLVASVLAQPRDRDRVLREVSEMRARIAAAKTPEGPLDAKIGPGRLQDIELFGQAGALIKGRAAHLIADGLRAAGAAGLILETERDILEEAYEACWTLQCAGRLLSSGSFTPAALGQAGCQFLARRLGKESLDDVEAAMSSSYAKAGKIIVSSLAQFSPQGIEGGPDEG